MNLEGDSPYGRIEAITMCNGHIYGAGWELNESYRLVATVWVDGVPTHFLSGNGNVTSSQAIEIYSYGEDVYVLTSEYNSVTDESMTYLWVNGRLMMSYQNIAASGFTVL